MQVMEQKERKKKDKEKKELEDQYWEERALKQIADMNSAYKKEKEQEVKISAKAALGPTSSSQMIKNSQADAIDKLKHEIFDKGNPGKDNRELSVPKKQTMSYEQLQQIVRQGNRKKERLPEFQTEKESSFAAESNRGGQNRSNSPNKSVNADEINKDADLDNSKNRDFSAELAKFRQMRNDRIKKEGPVQKPYEYYLTVHKKKYDLGNPAETKVFQPKTLFLTDLEDAGTGNKMASQASLAKKVSEKKLQAPPPTSLSVQVKAPKASATQDEKRLLQLQKNAFNQLDEFKDINSRLKSHKLQSDIRTKIIKNIEPKEPIKIPTLNTAVKTYGVKGMFVPTIDWLADHQSIQVAQEKFSQILKVARKGEGEAQALRREIDRSKTAIDFRLPPGLDDPRVQLLQAEEQDRHLKQVVHEIESLLAKR